MKIYNKLFAIIIAMLGVQTLSAQEWTDKTSLLVNPSFESETGKANLTSGWGAPSEGWILTPSSAPSNSQAGVAASSCTISSGGIVTLPTTDEGNFFYVRTNWNNDPTFALSQVISGDLPAGLYRLTCKAASNSGNWSTSTFKLTLKEGDGNISTNSSLNKCSEWTEWTVELYKTDPSTSLTIEAAMRAGSSGNSQHYQMLLDDFKLEYMSFDDIKAAGWPKPQIPASNLESFVGTSVVAALYNVEADAFVTRGMTWATQAIATKLHNSDTQAQSATDRHHVKISAGDNGKVRFSVNGKNYLGDGGQGSTTTVYTDNGKETNQFIYTKLNDGKYKLKVGNATSDVDAFLDVAQPYGGQLTYANGQGFTEWAIIKFSDIENGKYASYKAKKAMYEVYKAVVDAGHSATYSDALSTALETYIKPNATASDVTTATNVLVNAVSPALTAGYVNAGALFTNPDMRGAGTKADWTSGYTNVSWGVFENYHTNHGDRKLTQTKTVPNGFYKVVFHGIWRQDGSDAGPVLTLSSNGKSASANVPCMTDIAFGVGNTNGENNWTEKNGKIVPNGMQSAGEALSHRDAQATVSDFVVSNNELTIEMNSASTSQWILAQGFDIYYKAESLDEYANLFNAAKSAAVAIDANTLNTYAANQLATALEAAETVQVNKEWYQARTAELNNAVALANSVIAPYATLKTLFTTCESVLENSVEYEDGAKETFQTAVNAAKTDVEEATTADVINAIYNTLETARQTYMYKADPTNSTYFDFTYKVINTTFDNGTTGWTSNADPAAYSNKIATNQSGAITGPFYENWNESSFIGGIHQTISGLPVGLYTVTAAAFRDQLTSGATESDAVYLVANNASTLVSSATPTYYEVQGACEDGILTIGIESKAKVYKWIGIDNVTLKYYGFDVTTAQNAVANLKAEAEALAGKPMNATVAEDLAAAISGADATASTRNELNSMIEALSKAIADANASIAEYEKIATYIAKANTIDESIAAGYKSQYENGDLDKAEPVFQALELATYAYVKDEFSYPVELEANGWIPEGPTAPMSGQHFDGTNSSSYLEQSSAAWGWDAWSISYKHDKTLPAGDYVFKVAGRRASGTGNTMSLVVTNINDPDNVVELGLVNDFPEGDTGLGINTKGETSFDANDEAGFANNGAGRGWQWRYVKFTLSSETKVRIAVNAEATTNHQWVGFCNATLQMTEETYLAANMSALDAPTAAAEALVDTKPMGTTENDALEAALYMPVTTGAELLAKIDALNAAVANANAWVVEYNDAKAPLVAAFERFETDFNDGANGALRPMSDEAWATLLGAVEVAAAAKDVTNSYDGFEQAAADFNAAMDAAEMEIIKFDGDATSLIKNADFKEGTTSYDYGNGQVVAPKEWTFNFGFDGWGDTKIIDDYLNVWAGGIRYADLSQTVNNLPNGTYKLSADIVTDANTNGDSWVTVYATPCNEDGTPNTELTARSKNVVQGEDGGVFANYEVYFNVEHGAAVIGVRTDKRYFKVKNFKLEYVSADAAKVANGILLQNAYVNRDVTSLDVTEVATDASGAEIYLNNPNAVIYANEGQVNNANNVIVNNATTSLVLTDGYEFNVTEGFTADAVSYNRTFAQGTWLSVCVPFDFTIPEGVKVETLGEVDVDGKVFTFNEVTDKMEANKPYIIKNSTENAALFAALESVDVKATPADMTTAVDGAEFGSTYRTVTSTELMEEDAYDILFFGTDGQLYYLTEGSRAITFKPFRSYIRVERGRINWSDGVAARVRHSSDDFTGIDEVETDEEGEVVIYDLMGRRVTSMQKGRIYIVNGKKMLCK